MKKKLLTLIVCALLFGTVRGQSPADTAVVFYHRGRSDIDPDLRDNRAALNDILKRFAAVVADSTCHSVVLRLDSYSSPDGVTVANGRLSEKRAGRLAEYLRAQAGVSEQAITIQGHGIDWHGLEAKVALTDVPYKEEVHDLLRNTPEWIFDDRGRVVDGRKRRLGMIRGGVPYNYLMEHVFPSLRYSRITLSYAVQRAETAQPEQPAGQPVEQPAPELERPRRTTVAESAAEAVVLTAGERAFRPLLAVKTNLLYWAGVMPDFERYTFVPNLEWEWFFKERWSLSATGNYMKRSYGGDDFFGISAWSVEPRWWFKGDGRFRWFYLGAYGQVGDYDVQNSRAAFDGTTGKFWGAGLSVGAAFPFSDRWGLEVGIRGGYRHAEVKDYVHEAPDYFLDREGADNHWGVTGIKASLYYRFGKGNRK